MSATLERLNKTKKERKEENERGKTLSKAPTFPSSPPSPPPLYPSRSPRFGDSRVSYCTFFFFLSLVPESRLPNSNKAKRPILDPNRLATVRCGWSRVQHRERERELIALCAFQTPSSKYAQCCSSVVCIPRHCTLQYTCLRCVYPTAKSLFLLVWVCWHDWIATGCRPTQSQKSHKSKEGAPNFISFSPLFLVQLSTAVVL